MRNKEPSIEDHTVVVEELVAASLQWLAHPYPYDKNSDNNKTCDVHNPVQEDKPFSSSRKELEICTLVVAESSFVTKKRRSVSCGGYRSIDNSRSHDAENLLKQCNRSGIQESREREQRQ